jgi:hypothetical protein
VDHRPLVLSPDVIWITLCQGLAQHVLLHPEELRDRFVGHEGKEPLVVRRDDFVKGSPDNPWPEVLAEFSDQLRDRLRDGVRDLLVADFSTTGPLEKTVSALVLMDVVRSYFDYEMHTLCGIPSVTLEGTADDWRSVVERTSAFASFGLEPWVKVVVPILEEFVQAAEGRVNRSFWGSLYKWHGKRGSGSPYITGWLRALFPYLTRRGRGPKDLFPNPFLDSSTTSGPGRDNFPGGPSRVPFRWALPGRTCEMTLIGGLMGVRQDSRTLALQPEIAWAVREASASG